MAELNDNAKKWVAALRSGEFKQCRKMLCNGQEYCCLGVACEVYIREGHKLKHTPSDSSIEIGYAGSFGTPPKEVLTYFGIWDDEGRYWLDEIHDSSLVNENDEKCKTFEEIADLIESQPAGLFVEQMQ